MSASQDFPTFDGATIADIEPSRSIPSINHFGGGMSRANAGAMSSANHALATGVGVPTIPSAVLLVPIYDSALAMDPASQVSPWRPLLDQALPMPLSAVATNTERMAWAS